MSDTISKDAVGAIEALGAFDINFEDENFKKLVDAVNKVDTGYEVSVSELKEIIKQQHSDE